MKKVGRSSIALLVVFSLIATLVVGLMPMEAKAATYNDAYWSGYGITITSQGLRADNHGDWHVDFYIKNDSTTNSNINVNGWERIRDAGLWVNGKYANASLNGVDVNLHGHAILTLDIDRSDINHIDDVQVALCIWDKTNNSHITTPVKSIPLHQTKVNSISFKNSVIYLKPGDEITTPNLINFNPGSATNQEAYYVSSDDDIVDSWRTWFSSVDGHRYITAGKNGTATLSAFSIDGDKKATCTVVVDDSVKKYEGNTFVAGADGIMRCYDSNGNPVVNAFKCDGTYTYYFQLDGTAMTDRLTYHPDGVHVIYFDDQGHEVFSNFAHVKKAIAGNDVDDFCFFDVYGHLYVDVLTYDQAGQRIYYANPYGVMEVNKWFQFSNNVKWADGTPADANKNQFGFANYDGTLATNGWTYDFLGRWCYLQGNGVAIY